MGGFAHALGHILKTGFDMTETGQRYNESNLRQQQEQQRLSDAATASVEHWQGLGGKMIHDGMVADEVPAADGSTHRVYRPPNPERYVAKVKAGKDTLQFEIPNDAEQHAYQTGVKIGDLHRALTDPTAASDRQQQQTEAARGTELTSAATARGAGTAKSEVDEQQRQRIGIPLPGEIANALGIDPNQPGTGLPPAQPLRDAQQAAPATAADIAPTLAPERAPVIPGKKRLLLPDELDKMATAAGKFVDYQSKADARNNKTDKVLADKDPIMHFTGPDGTVSRVVNFADGTSHVDNLGQIDSPKFKDDEVTLSELASKGDAPLATSKQKEDGAMAKRAIKNLASLKVAEHPATNISLTAPAPKDASGKPLTGDAYLATLPGGRANQVKAFAEGRQTQLPRGKELQPFMDQVNQYDPGFSTQRALTRKDFAPGGASGKNIQALNTASVHLDQLNDAAKAMANGSFRPGNAVYNSLATTFGGEAPTDFNGIKAAVASEMANALKGSATDQEIAAIAKTINDTSSPQQMEGIVNTNLHTLGVKLNTKDEQYHREVPTEEQYTPLLPTAAAVFQKHGIQPIQRLAQKPGVAPAGKVAVITPEGTPGFIDADKLATALQRGFKKQ